MKKINLAVLLAVFALSTTGVHAREASFEEMLGGDSGSIVRGLNVPEFADEQKISFPVPAGMESCQYASVQGEVCSFICKSGATVTRPRLNSSVAQNGGCARVVIVPLQKAAKGIFDGPQVTKVENAKYVCQSTGGGYAIAVAGKTPRIWQLDGEAAGAKEGLELANVRVTQKGQAGQLEAAGALSFFGQSLKINLTLSPDPKNGGRPSMTVKVNGEGTPLNDVPCKVN